VNTLYTVTPTPPQTAVDPSTQALAEAAHTAAEKISDFLSSQRPDQRGLQQALDALETALAEYYDRLRANRSMELS